MVERGFGLTVEKDGYGTAIDQENFSVDWFYDVDSLDLKLNDEVVTKSGSSRMDKRARPGIMKPTGSVATDADLQILTWFLFGYLDNYVYTKGAGNVNTHEFYGGENKELPSFKGVGIFDMLVKYVNGLLIDGLKLEVSDESMSLSSDFIYKTEEAKILGVSENFPKPAELENNLFIMMYDVALELDNKALDGVATSFSFEGKNNHDVDGTIGFGSRHPQMRAPAGKRENSLSIVTSLTSETVRSILNAEYGEVGAQKPSECKLLQLPLKLRVKLCEISDIELIILFPKCTLNVEYDMTGADRIEVTMNLATLGSSKVTLADGNTEVITDMYVKLVNNQSKIGGSSP